MSTANNGGPAFPHSYETMFGPPTDAAPNGMHLSTPVTVVAAGISVREYFAAKALPIANGRVTPGGTDKAAEIATLAYAIADAMIAERSK